MKIISYSDLHLEFGTDFMPPTDTSADLMILAGDIITCKNYTQATSSLRERLKTLEVIRESGLQFAVI